MDQKFRTIRCDYLANSELLLKCSIRKANLALVRMEKPIFSSRGYAEYLVVPLPGIAPAVPIAGQEIECPVWTLNDVTKPPKFSFGIIVCEPPLDVRDRVPVAVPF